MSNAEVKNKLKTLTQGQASDSVLDKMAGTFKALTQHADFAAEQAPATAIDAVPQEPSLEPSPTQTPPVTLGGLVYNIQLILPADRDQAVYDALFRSLKEHLLR